LLNYLKIKYNHMATNDQILNSVPGEPARSTFKARLPYLYQAKHNNDEFKNLGYDYHGKILKNTTSPELWSNPLQLTMIGRLESMMTQVLEEAKSVKKWFSIAHDKDSIAII